MHSASHIHCGRPTNPLVGTSIADVLCESPSRTPPITTATLLLPTASTLNAARRYHRLIIAVRVAVRVVVRVTTVVRVRVTITV